MDIIKKIKRGTFISGEKLFNYLDYLKSELGRVLDASDGRYLESLMHSQMLEIVTAESAFLKGLHKDKAQLSIRLNGLPSIDSLAPDLESMCKISENEESFQGIAKKFKKGMDGKNREEGNIYVPVSEEEWNKELTNRKERVLPSDIGFSIKETNDKEFGLELREDIYLQGYDKYSKEFPVLIREGRIRYRMVWDDLIGEVEESFYLPSTAPVLKGKPVKPRKKIFDDIKRVYEFGRTDYKGVRIPWLFLKLRGDSINYSKFLAAGTNSRVRTTENILEALKTALNRQVSIKGIGKNDLEQVLAFSMVPFQNAPTITPKEEDLYENLDYGDHRRKLKIPAEFDLIFTSGVKKVGEIEYVLPYNKAVYGDYGGKSYRFSTGGIILRVLGDAIWDENQNNDLKKELERVKKK